MLRNMFLYAVFIGMISGICCLAQTSISNPPADMKLNPFYTKYMDCDGIPVISSSLVDDRAFYRLQELLDGVLMNRPDIHRTLAHEGFRCIIIAQEEQVTEIPEYAYMKPKDYWNNRARGFGGPTTSCGEENLLNLPSDRYTGENIFIHELAHSIHLSALVKIDPSFQSKLDALYQQAMDKGLYENDYAATNSEEYWAESVQAFFDCDRQNDNSHNHVNTREELFEYDQDMASFINDVFRITNENDWRYKPYTSTLTVEKTPDSLNPAGSLPKNVWCLGFSVYGTSDIPDESMLSAASIIRRVFQERYDVLKALADADVSLVLCRQDSDLPSTKPAQILLHLPEDNSISKSELITNMMQKAYRIADTRSDGSYKKLVAKGSMKIIWPLDTRFDEQVQAVYDDAMKKGLWITTQFARNRTEYLTHGAAIFFDADQVTVNGQSVANRKQLADYDPPLAALLEEFFFPSQNTKHRTSKY